MSVLNSNAMRKKTTSSKMEEVRLSGAMRSVPKGPSVEMAYQ